MARLMPGATSEGPMCDLCELGPASLSRRRFFSTGAAALAAACLPAFPAFAQESPPQNAISPQDALKRLMEGNSRYVANSPQVRDYAAGRAARAKAQHPVAAILSCADSRVAPELVFDQNPGDLFVVRLAGNFVEEGGLASLEYAVRFLRTPLIMVLGHTNCGAVDAAIKVLNDDAKLPGHLPNLIKSIKPAVRDAQKAKPADLLSAAITENVRHNVRRLETAKPILSSAARKDGKIQVVGGVYNLDTGKVALV
jgi:carbonic anhydrase